MPNVESVQTHGMKVTFNFHQLEPTNDQISQDNEQHEEPLTKKFRAMHAAEKPYIIKGPQRINGHLQRTACPLLINADENDKLKVFRA